MNAFRSLGYTPRHGISSSYNNSMFKHLRNCQSDFSLAVPFYIHINIFYIYIYLLLYQQYIRTLISPNLHQCLLSSVFFIVTIHPSGCEVISH